MIITKSENSKDSHSPDTATNNLYKSPLIATSTN